MEGMELNIDEALEEIGSAVLKSISYRRNPAEKVDAIVATVDTIINNPLYLSQCEHHFKESGSNYLLFYISNIIYNLKKNDMFVHP